MKDSFFDKPTDRSGIDSLKWDVKEGELPMWVADMDFEVSPAIVAAMRKRLEKPTFGYNIIPDEWFDAYIEHWRAHGIEYSREELMFSTGVVPSISSMVRRLTLPAEKVVILTPVYNIFFNSIVNNGRYVEECPLEYCDGKYDIDFDLLDKKLADPQTRLLIFCNPHNPIGRNWSADELKKVGELCAAHGVTVISDEIHCDIQAPGEKYVPFAAASELNRSLCATCLAPTKAFNIAGLQTSAIAVSDSRLRQRIMRGINNDEITEPNSFAVLAAIAAFTEGGEWLERMNAYVDANRKTVTEFLRERLPELKPAYGNATYLLWIDCKNVCADSVKFTDFVRSSTGLFLTDGAEYGECGRSFFRMNIACPRERLNDGLSRLEKAVKAFVKKNG